MKFEWDEEKNRTNIQKPGIDFADAHEVFEFPILVGMDTREAYGEQQFVGVGLLRQRVVVIAFAQAEDDTIRVISVRKALKYGRDRFAEFLRNELGEG